MSPSSDPLPPLNCLSAFEAAARYLSVTRAAEELHLTQSAVSRQIKRLEQDLGRGLFFRESAGLRLTPAGERYYKVVQRLLRELGEATVELRRTSSERQLTIAASPTIASFWLSRLMPDFRAQHPGTAIRLLVVEDPFSLDLAEFDLGLYYLLEHEPPPGVRVEPVFDSESIAALCAPHYLEQMGPISDSSALLEAHVLLVLEDHYNDWMTWRRWYQLLDFDWRTPKHTLRANSYQLLINAALTGQGVTLGWTRLFDHEIRQGQLVLALPDRLPSPGGLTLLIPEHRHLNLPMREFRHWLAEHSR